jgi:PKD repeat protein
LGHECLKTILIIDMKNIAILFLFSATFSLSAQTGSGSCGCLECPVFLPDNAAIQIDIPVSGFVHDSLSSPDQGLCGVKLLFDHEYLGDLNITLISPSGQVVTLVSPVGIFGSTDYATWDIRFVPCDSVAEPDLGFSSVWSNNQAWELFGVYTGSYYPSSGCLENYNFGSANGIWQVQFVDAQGTDVGNIGAIELVFCDTTGLKCDPCDVTPNAGFSVSNGSDGWSAAFANSSSNGFSYQVYFGDGETYDGVAAPMSHVYPDTGTYNILWIHTNGCNSDTAFQSVYIQGALPAADFIASSACAGNQIEFAVMEDHVQNWHWLLPGAVPAESFDKQPQVSYPLPGEYDVCLIVSNGFGADTIKKLAAVSITPFVPAIAQYSWEVSGNQLLVSNQSQNANLYYWVFSDGAIFSFPYLSYYVTPPFELDALLVASNACDQDTAFVHILIESILPVGNFSFVEQGVCLPRWLNYTDNSANVPTSWQWTFEGGTPNTATVANPFVYYEQTGQFLTTLIVSNASGADTVEMTIDLTPAPAVPIASFFTSVSGNEISIFNTSQDATNFFWQVNGMNYWLGEQPPPYIANTPGIYIITLFTDNICDDVSIATDTVQIGSSGTLDSENQAIHLSISPNPHSGDCTLTLESVESDAGATLAVINAEGKMVWCQAIRVNAGRQNIPLIIKGLPSGVYALRVNTQFGAISRRFVLQAME